MSFKGLIPGSYTVSVEGRTGSLVERFGSASVTVAAGQSRTASLTLADFAPGGVRVGSGPVVYGQSVVVSWNPVAGAAGYEVRWDESPGFGSPVSASVSSTSHSFTPAELGALYVQVRARSGLGNRYSAWSSLSSPVQVSDPESAEITVVLARSDGSPAVGEVRLQGEGRDLPLSTDAAGQARFQNLPGGNYTVSLVTPPLGFVAESRDVALGVDQQVESRFEGATLGGVSGSVTAEETPLAGVTATLNPGARSAVTGSDGRYVFADVLEGTYTVALSGVPADVNLPNASGQVSVTPAAPQGVADFSGEWFRTSSLLVTVRGSNGSGVSTNVRVVGPEIDQTVATNAQGTVSFTGLRAGTFTVSLPNPPSGFENAALSQDVTLAVGQAGSVEFSAGAAGTVNGTVRVEGVPLANVTVRLTGQAGFTPRTTATSASGGYSFQAVPEGSYTVQVSNYPSDVTFGSTARAADITAAGQVVTVDFAGSFIRTSSVQVSVVQSDGVGVSTPVRLTGEGEDRTLTANAQGSASFTGLKAGNYQVSLTTPPTGFTASPQAVTVGVGQAQQRTFVSTYWALSVSRTGGGTATIDSDLPGISMARYDTSAKAYFPPGSTVTLNVDPTLDSGLSDPEIAQLESWGGDCASAGTSAQCSVDMTQNRSVSVTLGRYAYLNVRHSGSGPDRGSVTSNPPGTDLQKGAGQDRDLFRLGSPITLTAQPDAGYQVAAWLASCAEPQPANSCSFTFSGGPGFDPVVGLDVDVTWGIVAPGLVRPTEGGVVLQNTPNESVEYHSWNTVSGATAYEGQIFDNPSGTGSPIRSWSGCDTAGPGPCNYNPRFFSNSSLPVGGPYYWRVRAQESNGIWGAWSLLTSFTVELIPPPDIPVLVAPADQSNTTDSSPTFSWQWPGGTAVSYFRIEIDDDPTFSSPVWGTPSTNQFNPGVVLPPGWHYWRVKAVGPAGNDAGWSTVWAVEILP